MRVWLLLGLSAVTLLLAADPLRAGDAPAGERDMFEKALDLGIWTVVVFLILLFVLTKFAWKPMLEGLEKRERDIASAVEDARKAREEAALARQQLAEEIARGHEKVRVMIEEARKDAERLAREREAQADAKIEADRQRLQREINVAKDQAIKEMWTQSAQLAELISSKAIRRNLGPEDHRSLVEEALAEMNRAFEDRQRALGAGSHA